MRHYEASSIISASPEVIWKILTDAAGYSLWDSGIERIEGQVAPDASLKVFSKVSPGRAFPVKVVELSPHSRMVWSGGMPLGLFKGVRTFTLEPLGDSAVKFKLREEFSGPMLNMIWSSMPDLGPSFKQFAEGLKAKAESN